MTTTCRGSSQEDLIQVGAANGADYGRQTHTQNALYSDLLKFMGLDLYGDHYLSQSVLTYQRLILLRPVIPFVGGTSADPASFPARMLLAPEATE
jgi:hypothetical protein